MYSYLKLNNQSTLDTSVNIKKLIATVVFALGAWMSSGVAQAQLTYYNFDYTSLAYGTGDVIGVFGVDGSSLIQSISGTVSGTGTVYDGAISGLLPIQTYGGNDNLYSPTSPYLTIGGIAFYTGSNPVSAPNMFNLFFANDTASINNVTNSIASIGLMTSSLCASDCTGGAPEIDGSLIPQVGLLLACLFILFGRKKENTEVMLAA